MARKQQLALGEALGGGDGGGDGGGAGPILFHTDAAQSLGKVGFLPHHFPQTIQPYLSAPTLFNAHPRILFSSTLICLHLSTHLSTLVHTSPQVGVDVRALGVDMATVVGHKFGAPKGVAALYIRYGAMYVTCGGCSTSGAERHCTSGVGEIYILYGALYIARLHLLGGTDEGRPAFTLA